MNRFYESWFGNQSKGTREKSSPGDEIGSHRQGSLNIVLRRLQSNLSYEGGCYRPVWGEKVVGGSL